MRCSWSVRTNPVWHVSCQGTALTVKRCKSFIVVNQTRDFGFQISDFCVFYAGLTDKFTWRSFIGLEHEGVISPKKLFFLLADESVLRIENWLLSNSVNKKQTGFLPSVEKKTPHAKFKSRLSSCVVHCKYVWCAMNIEYTKNNLKNLGIIMLASLQRRGGSAGGLMIKAAK